MEDLDLRVFRFTHYGKNRIKTFNVSPDVYIQLMLQWTYYKLVFYFYFKFSRQDLGIFERGVFSNHNEWWETPPSNWLMMRTSENRLIYDWCTIDCMGNLWQLTKAPPLGVSSWAESTTSDRLHPHPWPGSKPWTIPTHRWIFKIFIF